MWESIEDVIADFLSNPLSYSLGIVVLGLVSHKILSWIYPSNNEVGQSAGGEDGLLSDMVIPYRCIRWRAINLRGRWHTSVSAIINPPSSPHWKPLLVFANRKSGSNQGAEILDQCRKLLNSVQVHDLSNRPPSMTLELCQLLPDTTFIILVCGGDGSVNWVLTEIDKLNLQTAPIVAVLPLGTGNDLSNMLGWGTSLDDTDTVENFLAELRWSHPISIDRWFVTINEPKGYLRWGRRSKRISVTNYFSIGCDALIALNFHKQRQKKPSLFTKRSLNKLFYVGYGAIDILEQHCKDLDDHIELWLDGKRVELPPLEGLLFLNISSWGGGCKIWDNMSDGDLQWKYSDPGDGAIEVMGLASSFHMAQMQVQLAEPIRLGQAHKAALVLKKRVPMQADGEPWEQDPCHLDVTFNKQVTLLMKDTKDIDDSGMQLETS